MHSDTLSHLSPHDRDRFWGFGLGGRQPVPFPTVHAAFEYHAQETPTTTAVEHLEHSISYASLEVRANRLAAQLRQLGVRPGARVCVLVQRSIHMVVAILAILKAGGAYVPLDGGIVTDGTLQHVLEDSGALLVLSLREFAHRVQSKPVLCLEDVDVETEAVGRVDNLSSPADSAYIIYTSGTTGKPKGVEVTHRNVTNLLCVSPGNIGMRPGLRVSQLLNVAFDMCAWEVLGALSNGCTLCLRGKTSTEWRAVMRTVDVIISTPSILGLHDPAEYPQAKFVATAGEPCPQSLADAWSKHVQFFNSCGPTEVTIVNTVSPHVYGTPINIGKPVPNTSVYILDDNLLPVPIGEPGLMWAGGACVSRGYLNMPEQTGERYRLDPFIDDGMMFNTGDIGRWRDDGTLEHLGRADDQVKIKGFRVELNGVSAAMETCNGVSAAAALLIGAELWGFYTPSSVNKSDVESATAKVQPYYAVPKRYVPLEKFPHTSNGKIDKRVLRKLAEDSPSPTQELQNRADVSKPKDTHVEVATPVKAPSRALVFKPYVPDPTKAMPPPTSRSKFSASTSSLPGELWLDLISQPEPARIQSPRLLDWQVWRQKSASSLETASSTVASHASQASSVQSLPTKEVRLSTVAIAAEATTVSIGDEKVYDKEKSSEAEEGRHFWDDYLERPLPEKTQGKWTRNLRHQIFTLYRRLFGVVFVVNAGIFISVLASGGANAQKLGLIVVSNLFCAILMRQDYVVNAFFNVFCAVPTSWPLSIRRICARVYHIGGLHSGCAISGVLWLIYFTIQATIEMSQEKVSIPTVVITYVILLVLFTIVLFAWPKFRIISHDRFERTHRFMGWSVTGLVWAQIVLLTNDYKLPGQTIGHALRTSVPFWLLVVMTASIIVPWLRLRKVTVKAEVLSKHAVRLYFDYVTPVPGSYTRVSASPLMEWHSFATVAEPGKTGYSLVVSRAGDWTSDKIENPPSKLWVRGIPTCGVLRIVPLFNRLVFVATGSGIGPCAPCILEQRVPIRLLWTSPNVRQTFGDKFVDQILDASPDAVVYDTRKYGKPDMVKLTYKLVTEFKAEAVCVISNQKLTRQVVYGMVSRGVPAFGAIWDS